MGRSLRFVIPGDSNELGPNRRLHWQAKRKLVKKWYDNTGFCINVVMGDRRFYAERVRITFTLRRGRLLDPDNAHSSAALKAIVDRMKGWLFPDDKAACCEYGSLKQETGSQYRHTPEVEVLIEEVSGPPDAGVEVV